MGTNLLVETSNAFSSNLDTIIIPDRAILTVIAVLALSILSLPTIIDFFRSKRIGD